MYKIDVLLLHVYLYVYSSLTYIIKIFSRRYWLYRFNTITHLYTYSMRIQRLDF